MAGVKRPAARLRAATLAAHAALDGGTQVRESRHRRRMKQATLAAHAGISQARLAEIEAGGGEGAPLEVWFALAQVLGTYLRFEFARDPLRETADAGHLQIQELSLRLTRLAGWQQTFEAPSSSGTSDRSIDVRLIDRSGRRLVIGECWNTFGDLGNATRSSDRKLRDAEQFAVAIAGDGVPYAVGLCWIVRDTAANRGLVARYEHIFGSRFPGSSAKWVATLLRGEPMPPLPGLVWCDVGATRLFAHRRARRAR